MMQTTLYNYIIFYIFITKNKDKILYNFTKFISIFINVFINNNFYLTFVMNLIIK